MSDAYIATVLGTLGALTKGASWTYRTQQPAAPSFQPQLPPQEEDEQWWVDSDPLQLPPEDNQGVLLFVDTELPRVRAAMAAATVVHASETGQLARALRQAGLQTKAADVLFAGSGPVTLNTTLLPSASQAAAGGSNSSSADAQGSGSSTGGSEGGGGSSLSAGAIAALCICCVALVAAVAGTVLHVRRRRARQGRYEVFQEVQRSGSSPISSSSTGGKPYEH
ncbi:peptidase [Chlorella sorokiniana]|uniref:Peptidase n=1 Tax=Chlorella sorokiniana TaxID=3076 RepID=A0A2P6TU75_CHLSO|nr:peptidase [Chlorella sorokiniana]|eukprot:PRW57628.1 peptidase [Chlorella sorokiniana]